MARGSTKGKRRTMRRPETSGRVVHFDVWGCRGSRSLLPGRSRVGNATSCYSLLSGEDVFVFDAGLGLAALSHAVSTQSRFRNVRRIHVLITHAHMDHWEGLKDADWLWERANGLQLRISGPAEALAAIESGFAHPSYVPLEVLSIGTLDRLSCRTISAGQRRSVGGWTVQTGALNHFSGEGADIKRLDTVGYRLSTKSGPTVVYMCDHQPTALTVEAEAKMIRGAHLALLDAHFPNVRDQRFGHGSQEHAARVARQNPGTLILAGHHGPTLTDAMIRAAGRRHGRGVSNFEAAVEGRTYAWDARRGMFRAQSQSRS